MNLPPDGLCAVQDDEMLNPFIRGVLSKSAVLGGVAMLTCLVVWSWSIAFALGCGVCMGMLNLVRTTWLVRRVLSQAATGSGASALGLSLIFLLKLLVLFGVTYYAVGVVQLNALAYTSGYITLLVAITWQGLQKPSAPRP